MNERERLVRIAFDDLEGLLREVTSGNDRATVLAFGVRSLMAERKGSIQAQRFTGGGRSGTLPSEMAPPGLFENSHAEEEIRAMDKHIAAALHATGELRKILLGRAPHAPSLKDKLASDNRPDGCEWCTMIGWWNEVHRHQHQLTDGTTAALCHACIRRYADTGGVKPSRDDLIHKRDHGKWPKTYEKTA